jgi:DNA-binding transcriptional MocR family regulator
VAFKVLQAADATISPSEDDIFCDLQVKATPRLAATNRVHVRSFATLSGVPSKHFCNSRSERRRHQELTRSRPRITERLIYLMLVDGPYRKYLSRLHERLGEARLTVVRAFERIGLELFVEPANGMFIWARFPGIEDSLALAEESHRHGVRLAPGTGCRPHLGPAPWRRCNIAGCEESRAQAWLQRLAASTRAA